MKKDRERERERGETVRLSSEACTVVANHNSCADDKQSIIDAKQLTQSSVTRYLGGSYLPIVLLFSLPTSDNLSW